jgi:hypothetical protein
MAISFDERAMLISDGPDLIFNISFAARRDLIARGNWTSSAAAVFEIEFTLTCAAIFAAIPLASGGNLCNKNLENGASLEMCDGKGGELRWERESDVCQQLRSSLSL